MSYASPPASRGYIESILDTDLYKLTMQRAVLETFPEVEVKYRFTNRGQQSFTKKVHEAVLKAVENLSTLSLTRAERGWLEKRCPYFPSSYLDYLEKFRFNPKEQVEIKWVPTATDGGEEVGNFEIEITGLWCETVPLMSIISEAYFTEQDQNWDYVGQFENARVKGKKLFTSGCIVSEFGSRRRRTQLAHDIIIRGLISADKEFGSGAGTVGGGKLAGTSNVHFAQKYDLNPVGTIAHEWIMGIAAFEGYDHCNGRAMDAWERIYPDGSLSIALTDTFTTKPFFEDFVGDPERAKRWKGLRQDSGDPLQFLQAAKEVFVKIGADPKKKVIVFSDALDVEKCKELNKASDEAGVGCSFGVGTHFTNDFKRVEGGPVKQDTPGEGAVRSEGEASKALNMVIKLYKIDNEYCVKISDELTKNTGNPEAVKKIKEQFGLETSSS
ncbi:nicotinate phosphoribosyltransferase [Sporobolomyces salmoneus]|uniref:nicotinate phosphoribosyltransferase n=1 Tax=Sporobolomyces salmoneus TaxID=183962 RepID=UPI00317DF40E